MLVNVMAARIEQYCDKACDVTTISRMRPLGRIVAIVGATTAALAAATTSVAKMALGTVCQSAPRTRCLATLGSAAMQNAHILRWKGAQALGRVEVGGGYDQLASPRLQANASESALQGQVGRSSRDARDG